MATENTKEVEMHVDEAQDGTATVELPENLLPPEHDDGEPGTQNSAPVDDGGDVDHPDDSDAVRAARRARRRAKKDLVRETNREKDAQLALLKRQNEELMARVSAQENHSRQQDLRHLDKTIEDEQVRLDYAKMQLAEATNAHDGAATVAAQEALFEAKQRLAQLQQAKHQATRQQQAPAQQPRIDPSVQLNATSWIKRNEWYKPDLSDADSKVAKSIDEVLTKEGWNPGTPEYWDELDNRLQKYLPHRYNADTDGRSSGQRTPRNTVGSSGREASSAYGGNNRTFTLTAEQVRAMKDAGMWDNPDKRAKMIKRYAEAARNQSRSN